MSERLDRLRVHSNHLDLGLAGVAHHGGNERWTFTYESEQGDDVALNMDRSLATYSWNGIFPAFEQHLPEMDIGLFPQAIWKSIYRDQAGMLWIAGQRRLGRLRFTRPREPLPPASGVRLTRRDILKTANGDELLADALSRLTSLPGVSGVQPKILVPVTDGDEGPRAMADTHLLKGNRHDTPYATVVEAACLELASGCGIEVPDNILSLDGRLLAVERFDLGPNDVPRGFDEACSLMGLWARDKYDKSYEALFKSLAAFIRPENRLAFTQQLFTLIAFNYAIENGDAHLKNFGLLYDTADDPRLSPAYDLLTTTCFNGFERDAPALPLDGRKIWAPWAPFKKIACARGLTPRQVNEILQRIADSMHRHQDLPARYADAVPAAGDLLMRMAASWKRGYEGISMYLHAGTAGNKSA